MTYISSKTSVLAIKSETTEGVPVVPTSVNDYVALQDDFSMAPELEQLESAELRASIGKSKGIVGQEAPTSSLSHYLRHSGVEGSAPNFRQLLKSVFGNEMTPQGIAASKVIQQITYTAETVGLTGNDISIIYTSGATAGTEVVTVVGNAISVQIETGVSTTTQIKTAIDGDTDAAALVSLAITAGQESTACTAFTPAINLEDGAYDEYETVASSTVSLVKAEAAKGQFFKMGSAVLVKDTTNGYSIRPVHSIATDDLTLGFNLAAAPAATVKLGKHVLYYPSNTAHQALSLWHYLGAGGALQLVSGAKVTEFSVEFSAGELINASYSLEGLGYYFNPVVITATNKYVDFTDDDGTVAAILTEKTYKDPHELADTLAAAMNALTTETHTVVYDNATGKFTIATSTSTVLSLLWDSGSNATNTAGTALGFAVAADDTGATTYTSDNALDFNAPQTAAFDTSDPLVAKDNEVYVGDATDITAFQAGSVSFSLGNTRSKIPNVCSASGASGSLMTAREVTVSIAALLTKYDADKFKRMRKNDATRFCYVFGTKTGGNWNAGKCGCIYIPTATVSSMTIEDQEGMAAINLELTAYVDGSNDEVFLSFV